MLIAFLNITECVNDLEAKIKDPQKIRISKIEKTTLNYTKQEPDKVCYTVVFHSFKLTVLCMYLKTKIY